MSNRNNKNDTISHLSSEEETNINSKNSQTKENYNNIKKSFTIKSKKKKVKFKSHFVQIVKIESYKKYNSDNEPKNRLNFHKPRYKEVHCTCSIF